MSRVTELPAADPIGARAHFEGLLVFETDCWDVHCLTRRRRAGWATMDGLRSFKDRPTPGRQLAVLLEGVDPVATARRRNAIAAARVEQLSAALAHFTRMARVAAGRDVPHILSLHANALAADHFDRVLDRYQTQGVVFVTFSEALADPIYRQNDRYIGPKGLSWLYRI
jgi:hypothetical protein